MASWPHCEYATANSKMTSVIKMQTANALVLLPCACDRSIICSRNLQHTLLKQQIGHIQAYYRKNEHKTTTDEFATTGRQMVHISLGTVHTPDILL